MCDSIPHLFKLRCVLDTDLYTPHFLAGTGKLDSNDLSCPITCNTHEPTCYADPPCKTLRL